MVTPKSARATTIMMQGTSQKVVRSASPRHPGSRRPRGGAGVMECGSVSGSGSLASVTGSPRETLAADQSSRLT